MLCGTEGDKSCATDFFPNHTVLTIAMPSFVFSVDGIAFAISLWYNKATAGEETAVSRTFGTSAVPIRPADPWGIICSTIMNLAEEN